MWGNLPGWIIAVLLIAAAACGAAYLDHRDRVTAPTSFALDLKTFGPLDLPIELQAMMPELSGSADASSALRTAVDAYHADFYTYDRAAQGHVPDNFDSLPAIAPTVEVAMSPNPALLAPLNEQSVTYKTRRPHLDALRVLGEALVRAALSREKADPASAIKYYDAALALGIKMYRERLTYAEFSVGLSLASQAAQQLAKLTNDARRAEALLAFEPARKELMSQRANPVWRIVGSVDPNIVQHHAGDVFVIAREAPERMWRVEAIFALGRYKYSAQRFRDRSNALRVLEELATNESDPIVKQAATAARDMTIEEFRMLH